MPGSLTCKLGTIVPVLEVTVERQELTYEVPRKAARHLVSAQCRIESPDPQVVGLKIT